MILYSELYGPFASTSSATAISATPVPSSSSSSSPTRTRTHQPNDNTKIPPSNNVDHVSSFWPATEEQSEKVKQALERREKVENNAPVLKRARSSSQLPTPSPPATPSPSIASAPPPPLNLSPTSPAISSPPTTPSLLHAPSTRTSTPAPAPAPPPPLPTLTPSTSNLSPDATSDLNRLPRPPVDKLIELNLVGESEGEQPLTMRCQRSTRFSRLVKAYADYRGIRAESLRLRFGFIRIREDMCVGDIPVENGDTIKVTMR